MSGPDAVEAKWRRYLRFWRRNPVADIDDELRHHLDARINEFQAAGMPRDVAEREARARFGDPRRIAETLRDITRHREATMRRSAWMDTLRQNVAYAVRQLIRNPGFTAPAILTLALGIGANTAIFSVVYSVILRPLPYANADRVYSLRERNGPQDTQGMFATFGNFATWIQRARSFEAIGGVDYANLTLTGHGDPQPLWAYRVSEGYWRAEYIPPVIGRYFHADEDRAGAPRVVVLSYGLWQSAFGGDRGIVGQSVTLSDTSYAVIGVAAPEYNLTQRGPMVWVPLAPSPSALEEHSDHELSVVGLVKQGVAPQAALAELAGIEAQLARQYPHSNFDGGIVAVPLGEYVVGRVRPLLLIIATAVGLVLLIACGNVTNLLLARSAMRHQELAVRGALGAGRRRIVAQLLTESAVLAVASAVSGLAVAAGGIRFLTTASMLGVPRLSEASINAPVLLFSAGLAVACSLAFGLAPALRATRVDLQASLRASGRQTGQGPRERIGAALIVVEVTLALTLVVGAGLLVQSAIRIQRVAPGFAPDNLITTAVVLPRARYASDTAIASAWRDIQRSLAAIPGVRSVALTSKLPIASAGTDCRVATAASGSSSESTIGANVRSASAEYFATMGIPLVRGRGFSNVDVPGSVPVVMINRALARRLFGAADPIGGRIACVGSSEAPDWRQVIGVTGDIHASGLDQGVTDEMYIPYAQAIDGRMAIVIRSAIPAPSLAPAMRHAVAGVDPLLPLATITTMDAIIDVSTAPSRFVMFLMLALGVTAVILATIGIYGVISYTVAQRSQEFGIRMALGADARSICWVVVREAVSFAGVGVVIGLGIAAMLTRVLSSLLFGVTPHDVGTFGGAAALFLLVAALASAIPARRATGVDPLTALRSL